MLLGWLLVHMDWIIIGLWLYVGYKWFKWLASKGL